MWTNKKYAMRSLIVWAIVIKLGHFGGSKYVWWNFGLVETMWSVSLVVTLACPLARTWVNGQILKQKNKTKQIMPSKC